jgi:hypothetical protein
MFGNSFNILVNSESYYIAELYQLSHITRDVIVKLELFLCLFIKLEAASSSLLDSCLARLCRHV